LVHYYGVTEVGFVHTESGLPRRAVICACGGKAFELYYVRLHHRRQTEGGLTRRTGLDRGGQRTFVFWGQICQVGSTEWRKNSVKKLIEKVREYVFLYNTGHPGYKNLVKKASRRFRASTTVSFFFCNSVLTEEVVLPHLNWT
jgi:hypothetical protein